MACTSPRTTQLLHEPGDLARLCDIGLVLHQLPCFGSKAAPLAVTKGGFADRLARCLRPADSAAARDFIQGAQALRAETQ